MNKILYRHKHSFLRDLAAAVKLTMEWRRAEQKQSAAIGETARIVREAIPKA